jgi:hypothetical protein
MKSFIKLIFLLCLLIETAYSFDLVLTGDVYSLDKTKKILNFERHEKVISKSEKKIKGIFKDLDGNILVIETATIQDGKTINAKVDHIQTKESGTISVSDGKIYFEKKVGTDIEKDTEDYTPNFTVGMSSMSFIKKNWSTLIKGDTVESRFGVWYRKDTVGFDLFKTREFVLNGEKVVEIKMSASSFIIRAIVDPIYFVLNKNSLELKTVKGRISPKLLKNGKLTDLDAYIEYSKVSK